MKFKKVSGIVNIALTICLIFGSLCGVCAAGTDGKEEPALADHIDLSGIEDGETWTDPADGTEYIVLKSAKEMLQAVKNGPAYNYILGTDIDLGGKVYNGPLFGTSINFYGILNGNGYSIRHFSMKLTTGQASFGILFAKLTGNAQIRDLTVGNKNEPIQVSLTANGTQYLGGIAGQMTGIITEMPLWNVSVCADISCHAESANKICFGGIVGSATPCTIGDCGFYGSFRFEKFSEEYDFSEGVTTAAGGIVGQYTATGEGKRLTILNCRNEADIDISERKMKQSCTASVGGILGNAESPVSVTGCSNAGRIVSDHRAGGIVGSLEPYNSNADDLYEVKDCRNTGIINLKVDEHSQTAVQGQNNDKPEMLSAGGILGTVRRKNLTTTDAYRIVVSGCENAGNVFAESVIEDPVITNLVNNADVGVFSKARCVVGGILGRGCYGYYTIENCANTGTTENPGKYASSETAAMGGIFGFLMVNNDLEKASTIRNCYAVMTMTGADSSCTCYALGIAYRSGNGCQLQVSDCFYRYTSNGKRGGSVGNSTAAAIVRCEEKSAEAFANGEVAYLLGKGFGQKLGKDGLPLVGSPDKVAYDGDNYINTDAEHLLDKDCFAYVQRSLDGKKVRVILTGNGNAAFTEEQVLTVTFSGKNGNMIKTFTVTGEKLERFLHVEALGEIYYAESGSTLFGVIIKGIPAGALPEGEVTITVTFGDHTGSTVI